MATASGAREAGAVLAVPGLFALPDLPTVVPGVARVDSALEVSLRETYHDAPDLRLTRAGFRLCHHAGEAEPRWELALPDGDVVTAPGSAADESVPAELRGLLTARLRGADVGPVAVLRTDRQVLRARGAPDGDARGDVLAELVDDTVSVLDGRRVTARFREVALRPGPGGGAEGEPRQALWGALVEALVAAGAEPAEPTSRLLRALGPRAAAPPDLPPPVRVGAEEPAEALIAHALASALRGLVEGDLDARRGHPEAVHRLRVTCRRLRSVLAAAEPLVFPAAGAHLRAELAWLADSLGAARDLEVLRARLRRTAAADPVHPLDASALDRIDGLLEVAETAARGAAAAALDADRHLALLDGLTHWAGAPPVTDAADAPSAELAPALVAGAWRDLERAVARLRPDGEDEAWHAARRRAKRARYAAELVVGVLGGPARRVAKAAVAVQDALGEHQDAALAAERLLALAGEHADDRALLLTAARLAERERAAVLRARAAFPEVWRSASRRRVTRWLDR